ncbi:MAG TPA: glycosyltransferase family 87 protein, partial [Polyangia bacterium]
GARAWEKHLDIYSPAGLKWAGLSTFGHPPTTPLWYLPFTPYDIFDLTQLFGHFLIFMLLIHLVLVASELRVPMVLPTALLSWALVMDTQWWVYHVTMIQLSEPIAFLYVLAWICLRRDHEIASGILLGLACSMKVYAGLLVLLLLVGKRWRGVAAAVVVYLGFVIAATWGFGSACWREYLPMMRDSQEAWVGRANNASLQGIMVRAWPTSWMTGHWVPKAMLAAMLLSALIIVGLLWLSRRDLAARVTGRGDEAIDLPFALFSVASVWLNPVAWEHYNATLPFPLAVAFFAVWRQQGRARILWIVGINAMLLFVAWLLSIDMYEKTHAATPAAQRWFITANWLPWPLTMTALGLLFWRRSRLSSVAAAQPA